MKKRSFSNFILQQPFIPPNLDNTRLRKIFYTSFFAFFYAFFSLFSFHSSSATGFQFSAYLSHFAQRCSTVSGD